MDVWLPALSAGCLGDNYANVGEEMKYTKKMKGFTLIELMIVVAIIAIIAGIAIPSYMESVRRSNRSDAKVELNDVAQRLQRCFTAYSAYNNATCGVATSFNGGAAITSQEGFYSITAAIDATTFTLTAEPIAGTTQASDRCTRLTLEHTGARGAAGASVDECW